MKRLSENINRIEPSGIRKVNEKASVLEKEGKQIFHFELGRPDFDTPDFIKKACITALQEGNVFYTSNYGLEKLRNAISDKLKKENGLTYDLNEILVTAGVSEAVWDVLCTILNPQDEILIPDPGWINYKNISSWLQTKAVYYTLKEENNYQIQINELEQLITPKTKAIVLINPHNPTGAIISNEIMEKLTILVQKHDLFVLSDEIYEQIVYDDKPIKSFASMPGMKERTFVLNGLSKAYSMTGWRIGYVAAPAAYIKAINKIHQHNTTCASSFIQEASIEALKYGSEAISKMVQEYQKRRNYVVKEINSIPNIHCFLPQGAFYAFINIKETGYSSQNIADALLERTGVATVPGNVFGPSGEGYIRLSFAASQQELQEGIKQIKNFFENIKKEGHNHEISYNKTV